MKDYLKILSVDEHSTTPKHVQVANAFLYAIENGEIITDDVLPPATDLGETLNISTNAIEQVYKALKNKGIIVSTPQKEVFSLNTEKEKLSKILVLFDQMNSPKKIILDAFIHALIGSYIIDFHIYNNELRPFKKIIAEALTKEYAKFVIISSFEDNDKRAYDVINSIPKDKLLLIDKLDTQVEGNFAAVFEDFEKDIYEGLIKLSEPLGKYTTIKLLYPEDCYYPREIINGFTKYCMDYAFEYGVFTSIDAEVIKNNVVYICLSEDDLILFVDRILLTDFKIGTDIGIIAYNETPIKKIVVNGITTISSDLKAIGSKAAEMILADKHERFVIPCQVNKRNSL